MNKITKRLLSILAVLALVLSMAPAGILAVETKAESQITPGQASLPEGIAEEQTAGQAKQDAAKAALEALKGTDAAARLAELNEELTTCPFCGQAATWVAPSTTAANAFGQGNHYYIYESFNFSKTTANSLTAFVAEEDDDSACILLDQAKASLGGTRILMSKAATLNIGGTGYLMSSMDYIRSTGITYDAGIITMGATGVHKLNLYGGNLYLYSQIGGSHVYNTTEKKYHYFPVVYSVGADNEVNLWSEDAIIGRATQDTTKSAMNLYMTAGTMNIYNGTFRNSYAMVDYEGWNLNVTGGVVNMYGGAVTGGSGTSTDGCRGGNVFVGNATFNMYGGTISDGSVSGKHAMGGNLSAMNKSAVVNLLGGTIEGGSAPNGGGNVNFKYCSATIGGTVKIADGESPANGGNIHFNRNKGNGSLYVEGNATITGGESVKGGGSIYLQTGDLTIGGNATITGGEVTGSDMNGGNIYVAAGSLTVKENATITLGTAKSNGGNIWVAGSVTANINGGKITNGTAVNGGNIFANGTVNVGAAEIKDGLAPYGGNIAIVSGKLITGDDTVISGGSNASGYSSYGGNIFLRNAKEGTLLKGTISGGTAANGGNVHVCAGSKVELAANITGGIGRYGANVHISTYTRTSGSNEITLNAAVTVVVSGGQISGGIHKNVAGEGEEVVGSNMMVVNDATGKGTTLTLKGEADIEDIYFQHSGELNKLIVDSSWTGEAGWDPSEAIYCGESVPYAAAAAAYTGTLTNLNGNHGQLVWDGQSGVKMVDYEVIDVNGERQGYADAADAVADAKGDMNKRIVAAGNVALDGETVVIDGIGDIKITGNGTVYGIDQTNDGFKNHSGVFTVDAGIKVEDEVTYNGKHYIALTGGDNGEKYTFHRVEAVVTNVTVNVDNAGMYYKAEYKFDSVVAARVEAYGFQVQLDGYDKVGKTSDDDKQNYDEDTHTLTANSHGVFNIFKPGKPSNQTDGETKLIGSPYLKIDNGKEEKEFAAAEATSWSLAGAMELANEKWERLTDEGKDALKTFFAKWLELGAWDSTWAAGLENINPQTN